MKVSMLWLNDYLGTTFSAREVADILTRGGLEVEGLEGTGDEAVLEVEITTNRPDWLCLLGVAREVAALSDTEFKRPEVELETVPGDLESMASVEVLDPARCPRYTARIIRGITVCESPDWLKARLEAMGQIPRNNVVDITNFVLFETGQPLHAFDLDKLAEPRIIVRPCTEGETLVSLEGAEGKTYQLDESVLGICDPSGPVAIAGIKGGLPTGVTAETTDLLLESAAFEPINIRHTSRRLALSTDSSYRFERGVDPAMVEWASRRTAALIVQLCGGEVIEGMLDSNPDHCTPMPAVRLRESRIETVLGCPVPTDTTVGGLERLGCSVDHLDDDTLEVTPPTARQDLLREIDLVEEVARVFGYDNVPTRSTMTLTSAPDRPVEAVRQSARNLLTARGWYETLTISFVDAAAYEAVDFWGSERPMVLKNPLTPDTTHMRTSLVPSLMEVIAFNRNHGNRTSRLFEMANVFLGRRDEMLPREPSLLAATDSDWRDLKGMIEAIVDKLGLAERADWVESPLPFARQGMALELRIDNLKAGYPVSVAPTLLKRADLDEQVVAAELDVNLLTEKAEPVRRMEPLPRFPSVEPDLAVIVDDAVRWADIEQVIRGTDIDTLHDVTFFDEYRGKPVPAGKKSIAFSLTFRHPDRTLVGDEVDRHVQAIVKQLESKLSASLRK
ncbi:MAG: phenylalanine--tRNA ligase subunit beta [Planctomycetota bacterium]